jgi:7-cyano-7-deazaguanine reductase
MEFSTPNPKPHIKIADTRHELDLEAKFALLETFVLEATYPQLIEIQTDEFSAVCPGTGLPDIARLEIEYIPDKVCIELKSLKYYFVSYRNDGIFQEPVTDVIFGHLWRCLAPKYLKLRVRYNIRGGINTVTSIERGTRYEALTESALKVQ